MRLSLAALAAATMVSTVPAQAAPAPLQPTANWNVEFADAQCVASRSYGTAKNPLILALKASPLGDVMQLAVLHNGGTPGEAQQVEATLTIDAGPPLKTSILVYQLKKSSLRVHRINLRPPEFAPLRQARTIAIKSPGLNETLALTNIGPLLKTMDDCLVDLRAVWHITDPSGEKSKLKERAKANLAANFSNDDYPAIAVDQDQSGSVALALLVDEAGKIADCTVINTSGVAVLDAQSCRILQIRAKFSPAIGVDGKAAKDAVVTRVRWEMPD